MGTAHNLSKAPPQALPSPPTTQPSLSVPSQLPPPSHQPEPLVTAQSQAPLSPPVVFLTTRPQVRPSAEGARPIARRQLVAAQGLMLDIDPPSNPLAVPLGAAQMHLAPGDNVQGLLPHQLDCPVKGSSGNLPSLTARHMLNDWHQETETPLGKDSWAKSLNSGQLSDVVISLLLSDVVGCNVSCLMLSLVSCPAHIL